MTRSEIISTLIAFTVIGGLIVAGAVCKLLREDLGWFTIIPCLALVGIGYGGFSQYRVALRELKSRKSLLKKDQR